MLTYISSDLKMYYTLVHYECCLVVCFVVVFFFLINFLNGKMKSIAMVTKSLQFKCYVKKSN